MNYFEENMNSAASKGDMNLAEKFASNVASESLSSDVYEQRKSQMEWDAALLERTNPDLYKKWQAAEKEAEKEAIWAANASGNAPIFPGVVYFVDPAEYLKSN